MERVGPIDILVNNAGIETIVPFLELTDEQWTRLVDVNLRGGVAVLSGVLPPRGRRAAQAAIVNIGWIEPRRCSRAARTMRRPSSGSKR